VEITPIFIKLFIYYMWLVAPILVSLALTIIVLGQIVGRVEAWSKFDTLYWSFITAITVGYGDFRPVRRLSKALSVLIALVGIIFTGTIVALAIHSVSTAFDALDDRPEYKQILQEIQELKSPPL